MIHAIFIIMDEGKEGILSDCTIMGIVLVYCILYSDHYCRIRHNK